MPNLMTIYLREQIRLLKPIITKSGIAASRAMQDALGALGAKAVSGKVLFDDANGCPVPACFAAPVALDPEDSRVVLYLHGGGYVAGSLSYARGFAGVLASQTNVRVLCAAYRLAPESPYPAAVEDAFASYSYLLEQGYAPEHISLIGESAGGGLIFSLCLDLKRRGLPLPARLIALSPWTDLTLSGESVEKNRKKDICLTRRELEGFVAAYAPPSPLTPLASPLFGDLTGLPPCRIYVGGDEILLDDSTRIAERLRLAGVPCNLTVSDGLWHAYVLYGTAEAGEALDEIKAFLESSDDERRQDNA